MTPATSRIWGVVPAKHFEAAKSRLAPVLTGAERAELARSLFEHVLGVLARSPVIAGTLVVTDSHDVAESAERLGAVAVRDPESVRTLADAVDHALGELERRGAFAAIVLVGDLPLVGERDIAALAERLRHADIVVAKDKGGDHTNALALRLGAPFRTAFGAADSFVRHRQAAARAGLSVSEYESRGVAFDVDTPEDLAALRRGD